jgi:hypothetical protein
VWGLLVLAFASGASAQPAHQAELQQRYKAEHALPIPTAKADLTLSCAQGRVTAEIWFGAGIVIWHVPDGPQMWRLGAVTPTKIDFQRVIETYSPRPAGTDIGYVVVYADIDRITGEVHFRGENEVVSHTSGTCEKAVPKPPGNPKL